MRSLAPYALIGTVVGLGLALGTNVSGAVLALYGLVAGGVLGVVIRASTARAAAGVVLAALVILAVGTLLLAD